MERQMTPTKEQIITLLQTNDKAVGRALLAINARQTRDEQIAEQTKYHNNMGFTSGDAKRGTSMANYFDRKGYLTVNQLGWWRKKNFKGRSRIEKYATQLLIVAKEKQAAKLLETQRQATTTQQVLL